MEFTDATIIVSGAAGGIGAGVAAHLAALGARVHGLDLDPRVADTAPATGVVGHVVDVSDGDAVDAVVERISREAGAIDALVNAAGVVRRAPFADMPREDLDLMWRVNVLGTILLSQSVARRMIAAGTPGAIVNVASVAAEHVGPGSTAYATTKGAVVSFTRGAAVSLAAHGIRVNAVSPGPVETPMNADLRDDPAYMSRMLSRIPLGRQGGVSDIASTVAFLCGAGAGWITGEIIRVDGGVSVLR
ncbi:SDR family NAD(P)-dependent oxidoreductase [Microbacterium sp. RD1]|uniref:SDR family NAD(P)-dependent oxidoreductase n=1 Tax=Microbacterium sp. RD1 TaxID=3457313 RepID=UPI003FA5ECFD